MTLACPSSCRPSGATASCSCCTTFISLMLATRLHRRTVHKVRELIKVVSENAQAAYYPSQHLTIDEAMVAFKGRSKLRQNVPNKKNPNGFKVWMLVESSSGYVVNFQVFEGRGDDGPETGHAQRVVKDLIAVLDEQRWHVIGMDGFFSSIALFDSILTRGFYAVATTRNWLTGFPKSLLAVSSRLTQGQWLCRQRGQLTIVSWFDRKPVNLLSTYCDASKQAEVGRWRRSPTTGRRDRRARLLCPEAVVEYHAWMRGVDIFSQRESYSRPGRKSRRWWPRLAWFVIDMAVTNACVLYSQHQAGAGLPAIKPKAFRRVLMLALVGKLHSEDEARAAFHAEAGRERAAAHPSAAPSDAADVSGVRQAHATDKRTQQAQDEGGLQHLRYRCAHWLLEGASAARGGAVMKRFYTVLGNGTPCAIRPLRDIRFVYSLNTISLCCKVAGISRAQGFCRVDSQTSTRM